MHKLIVANYKMNGDKKFYSSVQAKLNKLKVKDTELVLCPPFLYLSTFKIKNKKVFLGSQDISNVSTGKSTGQIAPKMLKEFGVKYSIIGHSERRSIGESETLIAQKVKTACDNGLIPIVCVGESSKTSKLDVLKTQVESVLDLINDKKIVFAYEPVWAIGTGQIPTVKRINNAIKNIKKLAKEKGFDVKVLYGGSVDESNYKELLKADLDGFLLGGVSLNVEKFISIIKGIENE